MKWPFKKTNKTEKKAGADTLVQYQQGLYYIGSSAKGSQRLKDYVQGYRICDTVYSCINLIAQSAALVPWYVYRQKGDDIEEIESHPLVEFMDKPGPGMDWTEFLTRCLGFFLTAGNCYINKTVGSFGKFGQVEVLRPQHITIKPNQDGTINRYEYRVNNQVIVFQPEQIIHVKTFHPEDPLYGLSPMQVISRKIDITQYGELWTLALLENEARPSGALTTSAIMSDEQRLQLKQQLKDEYSGFENAGAPFLFTGDMKWQPFSFSPKELEFLNSKKIVMRDICAALKVPPELLGDNENKTYSNIKEARKALYQEAIIPVLGKFKAAFNNELVPLFDKSGVFFDYDVSGIDALSEDLNALWTRAGEAYSKGLITRGEFREETGYGELPGPDMISEPISSIQTPVDEIGKEPEPEPAPMPAPIPKPEDEEEQPPPKKRIIQVKDGFWQKEERKRAKWDAFNRRTAAKERALIGIAKKYLTSQADRIAREITKSPTLNMIDKWHVVNKEKEAGLYLDAALPWYIDACKHGINVGLSASKGEIFTDEAKGKGFWSQELEEEIRKKILYSGTKIAETTMQEVMDLLEEAEIGQMTVEEFARSIRPALEDKSPWRARRIAMTEAAKIENFGELEGYKQTEFVTDKGWICSFVEFSREAHMEADGTYSANPIPLDDPFVVGGEQMMEPLDDSLGATAGNIINCKCTMFPQVREI